MPVAPRSARRQFENMASVTPRRMRRPISVMPKKANDMAEMAMRPHTVLGSASGSVASRSMTRIRGGKLRRLLDSASVAASTVALTSQPISQPSSRVSNYQRRAACTRPDRAQFTMVTAPGGLAAELGHAVTTRIKFSSQPGSAGRMQRAFMHALCRPETPERTRAAQRRRFW